MFLILAWIIAPLTSGIVLSQFVNIIRLIIKSRQTPNFPCTIKLSLWPCIVTILTWSYIITY